ncbi:MAG: hypothetical protein ACETWE_12355 [Candidatus Bathyarchaeia archaeon]
MNESITDITVREEKHKKPLYGYYGLPKFSILIAIIITVGIMRAASVYFPNITVKSCLPNQFMRICWDV